MVRLDAAARNPKVLRELDYARWPQKSEQVELLWNRL